MWCLGQTSAVLHEPNQYDRYTESAFHGAWSPSKSQESFYRHGTLVWSPAHISLLREVVLISLGGHTVSLLGPLSPSDQERTLWVNAGRGTLSRRIHVIMYFWILAFLRMTWSRKRFSAEARERDRHGQRSRLWWPWDGRRHEWVQATDKQRPLRQQSKRQLLRRGASDRRHVCAKRTGQSPSKQNYTGSLHPLAWPCYSLFRICLFVTLPLSFKPGLWSFLVSHQF